MGYQRWQLAHPATPATMYTTAHPPTPHNTRHPGGHQPIPALQSTAPTTPPNTHHDMRPHKHRTQEEPPTPTQRERGLNTHSKGIKEGIGGT